MKNSNYCLIISLLTFLITAALMFKASNDANTDLFIVAAVFMLITGFFISVALYSEKQGD